MRKNILFASLSILLCLFSSCVRNESSLEPVREESVIEEVTGTEADENLSPELSQEEYRELITDAFRVYEEEKESEVLLSVVGDDGVLYYLSFVYLSDEGGYSLTGAPYYSGTLYVPAFVDGIPVIAVSDYAFFSVKTITAVAPLPDTIRRIGKKAFAECTQLSGELYLPSSLETIGEYAFSDTSLSGTLAIPSSLREISEGCFSGCDFFSLMIAEGVETIGERAFASMPYLTGDIYISESVKSIASSAFDGCFALNGSYLITPSGFFQITT